MKPLDYHDLAEMFSEPGCAVCNLLRRDLDHYLDHLLYEFTLDEDVNREFRASRGLCNEHAWQLLDHKGSSLSIALLYRAIVGDVLEIVEQTPGDAQPMLARLRGAEAGRSLADRLDPGRSCLACDTLAEIERRYLTTLGEHIGDPAMQEKYRLSDGLCLPHFRQTVRQARSPAHVQTLLAMQKAIWERLRADLDEFIAKNEYRRSGEPMGGEGDSWLRAARRMTGEKGIFGLDRRSS